MADAAVSRLRKWATDAGAELVWTPSDDGVHLTVRGADGSTWIGDGEDGEQLAATALKHVPVLLGSPTTKGSP